VFLALLFAAGVLVVVIVVAVMGGGKNEGGGAPQTVRFEEPTTTGEDPFTHPADIGGEDTVPIPGSGSGSASGDSAVGSGPFGGSGSDLVCDRELLIDSLTAQPDRLRAWAGVLGIEPTPKAVSTYIRSLTPVTLTVDTRVTNHTFVDGRAVPLQSILAAGTAVLVDKYGRPVVRCRCGNPLLEPIFYPQAKCYDCPPRYKPPPPCRWRRYDPWYGYPPEYLPPKWRDPYPEDYPVPKYKGRGRYCYVLYPRPPKVKYPPRWSPPEPEYTITDTYTEPEYTEPTYTEQDYGKPERTYTEPTYTDHGYTEPEYTEPEPEPEPAPEDNTYCHEEDAPDRMAPGCQGTYGPAP
jgi:hypothetical protein